MRIAYLTCVYPPYPGGIGMNAAGMASEMARRGHEVHVFTPRYGGKSEIRNPAPKAHPPREEKSETKVKVHYVRPWFKFGNAAFMPQVVSLLKGFDVIHLLYPFFGVAELIPIIRRHTGQKIVVHHMMDAVSEGWLGQLFLLHTRYIMPMVLRRAHLIGTLSEDYFRACDITYVYEQFEDAPPIAFIPNGVDTDLFRSASPRHPERSEGSRTNVRASARDSSASGLRMTNPPTILFVGGLDQAHYFKGIHVLIESLRMLKKRELPFICKIIGEGNLRSEYEAHVKEAGLTREILFTGLIPHNELPAHYQSAAFCVVPSTSRVECFSITAAEAQACGIPALVSNFPGARVTIQDKITGLVLRPGDPDDLVNKMELLLTDQARLHHMGMAGRERALRLFSWNVIGDKLEEVYKNVMRGA